MSAAVAHHYSNQLSVVMGHLELALIQAGAEDTSVQIQALENAMKATLRTAGMGDEMLSLMGNKAVRSQRLELVETCRKLHKGWGERILINRLRYIIFFNGVDVYCRSGLLLLQ